MDYESVLELVDELPLQDKRRLANHLISDLEKPPKRKAGSRRETDDVRIRRALSGMLTDYKLDPEESVYQLDDEAAESLLDQLHHETGDVKPLSTDVIEDRERP